MLQITYNEADRILLDMADIAEATGQYDQRTFGRGCGSPACMLGGYAWRHPASICAAYIRALRGRSPWECEDVQEQMLTELQLTYRGWIELFEMNGCDRAKKDGKKAAAYVREFVRKRAEARLTV